jgi:hypothetical protein
MIVMDNNDKDVIVLLIDQSATNSDRATCGRVAHGRGGRDRSTQMT